MVIDVTLALDNPLYFRTNLAERVYKLIVIIADKIKDEKLQHNINREHAQKWSFLLRIAPVNVTKCAVFCGFGHIYCRNP